MKFVILALVIAACSPPDVDVLTATARRPIVLAGGQLEQIQPADYVSSPGGASFNGVTPTAAGDVEADTFNGLKLISPLGGSSVTWAITQTSDAGGADLIHVNLTSEGTIDWIANSGGGDSTCNHTHPMKATGGGVLACPGNYFWQAGWTGSGFFASLCGAGCGFGVTWTDSDSTYAVRPTSLGYQYFNGYPGPDGDRGWAFVAPATTTQRVLRLYLDFSYTAGGYCVAALNDGSASASTIGTPISSTGVHGQLAKLTFTYHANTLDGVFLIVTCHLGTPHSDGSGGSGLLWFAETLGVI